MIEQRLLQPHRELAEQLIKHEGLELKPYKCPAGKITIGVGRNLEDSGLSETEALYLLRNDIQKARLAVSVLLGQFGVVKWTVNPARFDALANMAFNMGRGGLQRFVRLFEALKFGDYKLAAAEIINSKDAGQVGQRALELAMQMETGRYFQY